VQKSLQQNKTLRILELTMYLHVGGGTPIRSEGWGSGGTIAFVRNV